MQVTLENIGHGFNASQLLFSNMDLSLSPGRTYAVIGPSGSGKSTLLGILAGDIRPASGVVHRPDRLRTSWVFQNPHGVSARTALDHVSLPFLIQGKSRFSADQRAKELMEEFGLAKVARSPFRQLSGGEAQRLMLARAVATDPGLLLVDEPTAQLDMDTAESVNESLTRLSGRGGIVVIATHDPGTRDSCTDVVDLRLYRP